jgi:hypothetical protein
MDNLETLATSGNQEWTIQRHWQHWGTQDTGRRQTKAKKHTQKNNTEY